MATTSHVSRRSLLTAVSATLAGTALAAAPLAFAKASTPDPVFAALDTYRAAYDTHIAAINAADAADEAFGKGSWEYRAADAAQMDALKADTAAWWDLIDTRPTTLAGLLTYSRFLVEHKETLHCEQSGADALETIAMALEAMTNSRSA